MNRGLPTLLLFLSLAALRHQVLRKLGFSYGEALDPSGGQAYLGYLYDFCVVLVPGALAAMLAGPFLLPRIWIWLPLALVIWSSSLANTLYLTFFGQRLDFWIVKLHWSDTFHVGGSAGELGSTWAVFVSIFTFVLSIYTFWRADRRERATLRDAAPRFSRRWLLARARPIAIGFAMIAGALLLRQSPVWFKLAELNPHHLGSLFTQQILTVWYDEVVTAARSDARRKIGTTAGIANREENLRSLQTLAEYRDYSERGRPTSVAPLFARIEPTPKEVREARARLGLPAEGNLNVLVLFLESVRAYEVQHPKIGPEIFPRLRVLLDNHAIQFTKAYSSSFNAGQTVRGQFMTLCSMLDNLIGPSAYIYYSTLSVRCMQQHFKDHGYTTAWFNSYERNFHNKQLFESLHGMERFYDGEYFESKGVTQRFSKWGLADKPFLRESLRTLEEIAREGKPFFAHLLTISTHHPHTVIPEGKLPADLERETAAFPDYQGYLSRLKYTDDAVSDFIEGFLSSPLSENTVLLVQADHGIPLPLPHHSLTPVQHEEMEFRIPMALFSRNLRQPRKINYPVHQVDVAPTLARIAGLDGPTTWIGRDLFSGEGSPWLYLRDQEISYRTASRGCYATKKDGFSCFDLSNGVDPMYSQELKPAKEDAATTAFFRRVAIATSQAIELNLFGRKDLVAPREPITAAHR